MKIAFVNNQVQLGGAETVLDQLRRGVAAHGHTTSVHVAEGKTYPAGIQPLYPPLLSRLSHTRLHAPVEKLFPRAQWTDNSFRLLASSDADVVHVHNFHGNYASIRSLAHVARHKPLVWTFHALWGVTGGCDHPADCQGYQRACGDCPQLGVWPIGANDDTREQLQQKLELLAPEPLHIVAPSRFLAEQVEASHVGRGWHIHQIANGVDVGRFNPNCKRDEQLLRKAGLPGADRPTILVVNRNFKDERKGFPMVREALWTVAADHPIQVVFVGNNSAWAASQIPGVPSASMGYVVAREKLAALYGMADIFLFASQAENFPCVILEAMAAACCVVATPIGGVTEQIRPDEHGFLADAVSGPALGRALQEALTNPNTGAGFGTNARHRAEQEFSEQRMISRHLELYEEILWARSPKIAALGPALCPTELAS